MSLKSTNQICIVNPRELEYKLIKVILGGIFMPEKKYVDEQFITTSVSGERRRVFDPLARVREAFTRLATAEKSNESVTEVMFDTLTLDLDADEGNRDRLDIARRRPNHELLSQQLNEQITNRFHTEQGRQQAAALAEIYLYQLTTFRHCESLYKHIAGGKARNRTKDMITNANQFQDACLKMKQFINDRRSQDSLRFATSTDSELRIENFFDDVIQMVNQDVGIKLDRPGSPADGYRSFNYQTISDMVKPFGSR